jgi:RNA polymerase sigma-70 factor (ECF subfamily)
MKTTEFNSDFMQSGQTSHLENDILDKEETFRQLEQCIEKLPQDQKHSIQLFFIEKKCYNEISEITGHEWNQVRSYIQNGKRNLKICLEAKIKLD